LRGDDPGRPRVIVLWRGAVVRARRRPRVRPVGRPIPIRGTAIAATATAAAAAAAVVVATQRSTATSSPWAPAQRASKKTARECPVRGGKSPPRAIVRDFRIHRESQFEFIRRIRIGLPRGLVHIHTLLRIIDYYCVSVLADKRRGYSRAASSSARISNRGDISISFRVLTTYQVQFE
jgi:hypothetical protein